MHLSAHEIGWHAVAEQEGAPVHEAKNIGLKSIRLGPTERAGLRVESPAGNERFS